MADKIRVDMVTDFEKFLLFAAFDQGLAPFKGEISADWSSSQQNHRQKIKKELHDLKFHSISHCHVLGGYVGLGSEHPPQLQIGFDLEETARIEERVVNRVAHPSDEIPPAGAEEFALRWSAKEAAFKSLLGPCQPQVVSQIQLQNWKLREHAIWECDFSTRMTSPGKLFLWCADDIVFALAFWTPLSQIENGCREG